MEDEANRWVGEPAIAGVAVPEASGHLLANLQALAIRSPVLARRLSWPVDGSHVRRDEEGGWWYRIHATEHPFGLSTEAVGELVAGVVEPDSSPIALLGLGLGEHIQPLLDRFPLSNVLAWERDPWLMRLALGRADYTRALLLGRLQCLLGVDVLHLVDQPAAWAAAVRHPVLSGVYRNELLLLEARGRNGIAALCAGGLFVDDLADALRRAGYGVYILDAARLSEEEQAFAVRRIDPPFIAAINYTTGLGEFCAAEGRDLLCWEVDPTTDRAPRLDVPDAAGLHVFTYRSANVEVFRQAGFTAVEGLPLAANTLRRTPAALSRQEHARYAAPVSFVGSSMLREAAIARAEFVRLYRAFRGGVAEAEAEAHDLVEAALAEQRHDFSVYCLPRVFARLCPGFLDAAEALGPAEPVLLAAEAAAAEKRLAYVSALGPLGIHVWGDEGWREVAAAGGRYRGYAGHLLETSRVYRASCVNLDVGRLYQADIVTMRVFDILACGGFALTEHSDALEELFRVGEELESYRTVEELLDKAQFYLRRPDIVARIAQRGLEAVRARHTIDARLAHMLGVVAPGEARGRYPADMPSWRAGG